MKTKENIMSNTENNKPSVVNIPELISNVEVHMHTIDEDSKHPNQMMHSIAIVGAPGTAKTHTAQYTFRDMWAKRNGCKPEEVAVIVCRCAGRDAVEFIGMGVPQKETKLERFKDQITTRNSVPDLIIEIETARTLGHPSTNGKPAKCVLVILDEYLQGDAAVQKSGSSFVDRHENTLGGFDAGPDVMVVITGNRTNDKSGASKMMSMNTDRCASYELEGYTTTSIGNYADYLKIKMVNPLLVHYVESHVDTAPWDNVMQDNRSHMTFRSFYRAAKTIETFFTLKSTVVLTEAITKAVTAIIGEAGANSVRGYLEQSAAGVPTREEIMADPANCSMPAEMGGQAAAGNIAMLAVTDSSTAEKALEYISRMKTDLQVQLMAQVLTISAKGGYIMSSDRASKFISKHSSLLKLLKTFQ